MPKSWISGLFRMNLLKIWHTRKNCLNRSNRGSLSVSLSDGRWIHTGRDRTGDESSGTADHTGKTDSKNRDSRNDSALDSDVLTGRKGITSGSIFR